MGAKPAFEKYIVIMVYELFKFIMIAPFILVAYLWIGSFSEEKMEKFTLYIKKIKKGNWRSKIS